MKYSLYRVVTNTNLAALSKEVNTEIELGMSLGPFRVTCDQHGETVRFYQVVYAEH